MKILVASGNAFSSLLIKLFTFSKWTHTAVMFDNLTVIDVTYKTGVRRITLEEFKQEYRDVFEIDIILPNEKEALQFALDQLGKSYDYTAMLGILFRNRRWESVENWFCSELTETICVYGGKRRIRTEASGILPRETFAVLSDSEGVA